MFTLICAYVPVYIIGKFDLVDLEINKKNYCIYNIIYMMYTDVVYLITCTKCGKQYVGETGDHVHQQMNGHRDDWKNKRFERSPVAEHFCSPEHDFLNYAPLCCLDHNPEWTYRTRKANESYWIRRLNTTTVWYQ